MSPTTRPLQDAGDIGEYEWVTDHESVDWDQLSDLYRIAPLGDKPPDALRTVFTNSMFKCFIYSGSLLVGAGRALADGLDCSYIADIAVHPDHQGRGLGTGVINRLVEASSNHKKIILYAIPGAEGFYEKLGFLRMNTAMAIWHDSDRGITNGLLREPERG